MISTSKKKAKIPQYHHELVALAIVETAVELLSSLYLSSNQSITISPILLSIYKHLSMLGSGKLTLPEIQNTGSFDNSHLMNPVGDPPL
jgi:hypothetical protein